MEEKLARTVSILFHPVFMPVLAFSLLLTGENYLASILKMETKMMIMSIVIINTLVAPVLVSYFLLKKDRIKSFEMETPGERKIPYLITVLFYIVTCYLLKQVGLSPLLYIVLLCASLSLIATLLINLAWKISAHMVGIGGLVGAVICMSLKLETDNVNLIALLIVVAGLVGFSRLKLNAHSPAQVYLGFIVGFLPQLVFVL